MPGGSSPRRWTATGTDATMCWGQMGLLYGLERKCKDWGDESRKQERQAVAVPILAELGKWMKEQYVQVLPKSPVGKALAYSSRALGGSVDRKSVVEGKRVDLG